MKRFYLIAIMAVLPVGIHYADDYFVPGAMPRMYQKTQLRGAGNVNAYNAQQRKKLDAQVDKIQQDGSQPVPVINSPTR